MAAAFGVLPAGDGGLGEGMGTGEVRGRPKGSRLSPLYPATPHFNPHRCIDRNALSRIGQPLLPDHPLCGLQQHPFGDGQPRARRPHADAWIEIACSAAWYRRAGVTPHAGAWSGMGMPSRCQAAGPIPPHGAQNEISPQRMARSAFSTASHMGKWIERTPSSSRSRPPPAPLRGCAE